MEWWLGAIPKAGGSRVAKTLVRIADVLLPTWRVPEENHLFRQVLLHKGL
jgi:hypothetical protein